MKQHDTSILVVVYLILPVLDRLCECVKFNVYKTKATTEVTGVLILLTKRLVVWREVYTLRFKGEVYTTSSSDAVKHARVGKPCLFSRKPMHRNSVFVP